MCADNHGGHPGWIGRRNGTGWQGWTSAERCHGGGFQIIWTGWVLKQDNHHLKKICGWGRFFARCWNWRAWRVQPSWARERQSLTVDSQLTNPCSTCRRSEKQSNVMVSDLTELGPEVEFEHGRPAGTAPAPYCFCQRGLHLEIIVKLLVDFKWIIMPQVFKHAKRLGYGEHDVSAVYIRFENLLPACLKKGAILIPFFPERGSERGRGERDVTIYLN